MDHRPKCKNKLFLGENLSNLEFSKDFLIGYKKQKLWTRGENKENENYNDTYTLPEDIIKIKGYHLSICTIYLVQSLT